MAHAHALQFFFQVLPQVLQLPLKVPNLHHGRLSLRFSLSCLFLLGSVLFPELLVLSQVLLVEFPGLGDLVSPAFVLRLPVGGLLPDILNEYPIGPAGGLKHPIVYRRINALKVYFNCLNLYEEW